MYVRESHPVKTRAVRYIREPVKHCLVNISEHMRTSKDGAMKLLTMILVIATKARMKVMYVFVRLKVSLVNAG